MKCVISKIISNEKITDNIYKLQIEFDDNIKPGQFFMLKTLDNAFLLPRPISVHNVENNILELLYRMEGDGTLFISKMIPGSEIQAFGPLGNGFDLDKLDGNIAIIGGGIGTAPLLYLSKNLNKENTDVYLGFKDEVYCIDEFNQYANEVIIATEDGSTGRKGYITDSIDFEKYDAIYTCGPKIMMDKIIKTCIEKKIKVYASLESRMACGIGACLGCVVDTNTGKQRVCKEGPVFEGEAIWGHSPKS